jgi:murein L,D-transpeptidase YafK
MIFYGIILNTREISLREAMVERGMTSINDARIVIDLKKHRLLLYDDTSFVKSYKAAFGRGGSKKKLNRGDFVTPTGSYNICSVDTVHKFYKFLEINYPNIDDASEALREGYITGRDYNYIATAFENNNCTNENEKYSTPVGIHGIGEYNFIFKNLPFVFDWTNGSVAISDENIDEILSVVSIGTRIVIN